MSSITAKATRIAPVASCIGLISMLLPHAAHAHVKWFAAYDVMETPRGMDDVLTQLFAGLAILTMGFIWFGARFERTRFGTLLNQAMDFVLANLRHRTEAIIRGGTAAFFVSLWVTGGIILTPELHTASPMIPWLQAAIALGMVSRPTMALSGLGIVYLFVQGVSDYGLFHMMDYPIFLGLAGYLVLTGLDRKIVLGVRPLDIATWGTAITLMWGSVEKWAFPGWTMPVLDAHGALTLGFDLSFVMVAAGMVEFGLSFALVWSKLVRRLASVVLFAMFLGAVIEFGKIDAIGHMMILVLLIVIAADDHSPARRLPVLAPVTFSGALAATMGFYYVSHAAMCGMGVA